MALPAWDIDRQVEELQDAIKNATPPKEDFDDRLRKPDSEKIKAFWLKLGIGGGVLFAIVMAALLIFIPVPAGKQRPFPLPVAIAGFWFVAAIGGAITAFVGRFIASKRVKAEAALEQAAESMELRFHDATHLNTLSFPILFSEGTDSFSAEGGFRRVVFDGSVDGINLVGMICRQGVSQTMAHSYNAATKLLASQAEGNFHVRYPVVILFPDYVEHLPDFIVVHRNEPDCGYMRQAIENDSRSVGLPAKIEEELWIWTESTSRTKHALQGKYCELVNEKSGNHKWQVQAMGGRVAVWDAQRAGTTNTPEAIQDYIAKSCEIYADIVASCSAATNIDDAGDMFSFTDTEPTQ